MSNRDNIDVTIRVPIVMQINRMRVGDMLLNALEGGSNYWLMSARVMSRPNGTNYASEAIACGSGFRGVTDDGESFTVDAGDEELAEALALMATEYSRHFDNFMGENDDAETADVFMQLLAFGEVIYG